MKPLFDKPIDELREAFVRQRFAEPNIFGRPDIEEWLESQRENLGKGIDVDPWECDGFNHYALAVSGDDATEICTSVVVLLREHVTASTHKPDWSEQDSSTSNFVELLEMLRAGGAEVFYSTSPAQNDFLAVVIIGEKPYIAAKQMHGDKSEVASFSKTNVIAGLHLLDEEIRSERPKAAQALKYLLDQYRLAIAAARESAQRDFDEAVAVSADGTKIEKADWIVVAILDENRAMVYPAEAFLENKILLSPTTGRMALRRTDTQMYSIDEYVRWVLRVDTIRHQLNNGLQCLDPIEYFDDRSRLLTLARFCPSPLPDGGREIKV